MSTTFNSSKGPRNPTIVYTHLLTVHSFPSQVLNKENSRKQKLLELLKYLEKKEQLSKEIKDIKKIK